MFGLLDDFEQYPDYAMKTTQSGERIREPWASGPSPLAQGLMALGSGMVGDGATPWVGGGGTRWDDIGRGMRLGTQAFLQGHQDLQNRRSDYYTHRRAEENQLINNAEFIAKKEERKRELKLRADMIKGLPELFIALEKSNIPGIKSRIPILQAQARSGDIKGAYQSATNLNSQLAKVTKGKPEIIKLDNGQSIMVQKDSGGSFTVVPGQSFSDSSPFGSGMKSKAYGIMLKALNGAPGFERDSTKVQIAYESLLEPEYVTELNPRTGEYIRVAKDPYIPPSFKAFMGEEINPKKQTSDPNNRILKKEQLTVDEKKSAGYANRMQKAMSEMDSLFNKGYRPTRKVLEFVKMGAPQDSLLGRGEKEAYRLQMSPDDKKFARAVQDWLRAKLRKESGAVIGVEEASEEVEAFFNIIPPGASTSPNEVYETFRNARITALESMIGEAGRGWGRWDELGYVKKPRSSKWFYNNNPFRNKGNNVFKNKDELRKKIRETK